MAVTDGDQLIEVQNKLLEDASFTSGLWTAAEVYGYFNERQNRFNRDTKLMLATADIAVAAAATSVNLPQDWIATQRAAWGDANGRFTPLDRSSRQAALLGISSNALPATPILFDDQSGGTVTAELFPIPTTLGTLRLLYASVLELLNFDTLAPDIFDIPDDFVPYVSYGVMADMLSKEGRGRDLFRANYCEDRYNEGVAIAAILLGGFL